MDISNIKAHCTVTATGCWEWNRCVQSNGYGRIRMNGRTVYAHRAAYETAHGDIPNGMDVCHTCDNRRCCNPDHLFIGTRKDNMQDAVKKGRVARGPEHSARLSGEKGPGAKLNSEQVSEIRRLKAAGASPKALASLYGVTTSNIHRIVKRNTWKEQSACAA